MDGQKLRRLIEQHEGRRYTSYADSRGIPTVGVGFNLHRSDAQEKIAALGLDYNDVYRGALPLTEEQINVLLDADIAAAIDDAHRCVRGFERLPGLLR
jgi:GH24 family phage-related lysozyme (muramidase)